MWPPNLCGRLADMVGGLMCSRPLQCSRSALHGYMLLQRKRQPAVTASHHANHHIGHVYVQCLLNSCL